MYGYIYKVTCIVNNLIYIGQHKYNKSTLDPHYFAGGIAINKALQLHGRHNFQIELLDIAQSEQELNEKERFYIKQYYIHDVPDFSIGYNLSPGGKAPVSNKNRVYINNGYTNKMVYLSELNKYLVNGYSLGMLPMTETAILNNKNAQLNRHARWMTNGKINKTINESDIQYYLDNGWTFGLIRDISRPNNGMYHKKHSIESKQKMSLNRINKYKGKNCHRSKPCKCIETNQIFDSILDASNWLKDKTGHVGKIRLVCNGEREQTCGYHFIYVKESK